MGGGAAKSYVVWMGGAAKSYVVRMGGGHKIFGSNLPHISDPPPLVNIDLPLIRNIL